MEDNLITILSSFGYPVYRQGSMAQDATYPATFFTFWNSDSPDHAFYDNTDYGTEWNFDVNVYSSNPETTYTLLSDARTKLKDNGWIILGKGYDVPSDEATHTGRGIEAIYLEV